MGMLTYITAIYAMGHCNDNIVVSFDTGCLPERTPWTPRDRCPPTSVFNDTVTGLCSKTQNPYADVFRRIVTRLDEVTVSMNDSLREFVDALKSELIDNLTNLKINPTDAYYTEIATRLASDTTLTDDQITDITQRLKQNEECCLARLFTDFIAMCEKDIKKYFDGLNYCETTLLNTQFRVTTISFAIKAVLDSNASQLYAFSIYNCLSPVIVEVSSIYPGMQLTSLLNTMVTSLVSNYRQAITSAFTTVRTGVDTIVTDQNTTLISNQATLFSNFNSDVQVLMSDIGSSIGTSVNGTLHNFDPFVNNDEGDAEENNAEETNE